MGAPQLPARTYFVDYDGVSDEDHNAVVGEYEHLNAALMAILKQASERPVFGGPVNDILDRILRERHADGVLALCVEPYGRWTVLQVDAPIEGRDF